MRRAVIYSANTAKIKYSAIVEEINILNSCKKIMETAGLSRQASADEVKIILASLLVIWYSLLFVAFSLILLFNVTWVFEHICV